MDPPAVAVRTKIIDERTAFLVPAGEAIEDAETFLPVDRPVNTRTIEIINDDRPFEDLPPIASEEKPRRRSTFQRPETLAQEIPVVEPVIGMPVVATYPEQPDAEAEKQKKGWLNMLIVFFLLIIYLATSVLDMQFMNNVFSEDFNAPFLIFHVANASRLITFPFFLLFIGIKWLFQKRTVKPEDVSRKFSILRHRDPAWIYFIKTVGIMASVVVVVVVFNVAALAYISSTDYSTVSTTQVAMVYFVSVAFLGHRMIVLKLLAVVASLAGVAVIAYAKGFQADSIIGLGLCLGSTAVFSFNLLYYKYRYPKQNFGQCCMFLTLSSLFTLLVFWPLPIWAHWLGTEIWEFHTIPWRWLIPSVMSSLIASVAVNYCLILANPLLVSFTSLLRIPVNMVVDYFMRGIAFSYLELIGSLLIVAGFIVIVMPDNKVSIKIKSRVSKFFNT